MDTEPSYAWWRLVSSLLFMTMGSAGMYSVTVILPHLQADFETSRSAASLPYTLTMIGFGLGGVLMGRLADRAGIITPLTIGSLGCGAGFILAGLSGS